MKQPRYKPSKCRNCGKTFTYHNPDGTNRVGGRPAVYCSDKCRREWRAKYKRRVAQRHRREDNRELQKQGIEHYIVDFKRDRELEQKVMLLELTPEMLKNLRFDINFHKLTHKQIIDEDRIEYWLYQIDDLKLSTDYLKNNTTYHLEELGVDY